MVDSLRKVRVRSVACGSGHTIVLSREGRVLTWGRGDDGRLGHGDNGWKYIPRPVEGLEGRRIARVTCGSYHTAALSDEGVLFTWYDKKINMRFDKPKTINSFHFFSST